MDAATAATLSRVILEPVLWRDLELGDTASAAVIRSELASRTWQNINPYASRSSSPYPHPAWEFNPGTAPPGPVEL